MFRTGFLATSQTIDGIGRLAALAAALAALVVGVRWGTGAAGGSDSSCYLNEARLLSRFTTRIEQPLAVSAPWPRAAWTFTPAGHLPSPSRPDNIVAIVPMCPPGLPIVMAPARWIHAELIVVPLLGALAVWLTFVLGRVIAGAPTGAAAAILVACSPIFLYQIVQPMTDVPATAWWLLAAVLAVGEAPRPLSAGLAASLAVLTRPNLLPLALVVAAYFSVRGVRLQAGPVAGRPVFVFVIGLIPGGIVLALLNWRMYGSPVASGYGSAGDLFQLANVAPNLDRYARWLWQTHTPILALACLAPWLVARRAEAWLALALAAGTVLLYLPYRVFDDWWYIRFLLPAIPFLIVLSVAAVARIAARFNRSAIALAAMTVVVGVWWVHVATERHAFDLREWERHFIDAGRFASDKLPANAAVVTVKHSGSVHYYSQRPTIAWDTLEPNALDRALDFLRERGLAPMLMIDTEEHAAFRARFAESSLIGRLDWPPVATVARTVRVYDPAGRARYWSR